jgi:hypothetical protein
MCCEAKRGQQFDSSERLSTHKDRLPAKFIEYQDVAKFEEKWRWGFFRCDKMSYSVQCCEKTWYSRKHEVSGGGRCCLIEKNLSNKLGPGEV